MRMQEEYKRAAAKAMKLLLQQDRTEWELRDRLRRADFSEEAVCAALEYVSGFGYIDDYRYAVQYLSYKKGRHSRRELQYKLKNRGVPPEILQRAMEEYPPEDETEPIAYLVRKRLGRQSLSQMKYGDRNKMISYLARKGFDLPVIKRTLQGLSAEQ